MATRDAHDVRLADLLNSASLINGSSVAHVGSPDAPGAGHNARHSISPWPRPGLHRRARPSALSRGSSSEKVSSESSRFDSLSVFPPLYVPVPAFSSRSRIARRFPKSDFPARSSDWGRCLPPWMRDRGIRFLFPVPAAESVHIYFSGESSLLLLLSSSCCRCCCRSSC